LPPHPQRAPEVVLGALAPAAPKAPPKPPLVARQRFPSRLRGAPIGWFAPTSLQPGSRSGNAELIQRLTHDLATGDDDQTVGRQNCQSLKLSAATQQAEPPTILDDCWARRRCSGAEISQSPGSRQRVTMPVLGARWSDGAADDRQFRTREAGCLSRDVKRARLPPGCRGLRC